MKKRQNLFFILNFFLFLIVLIVNFSAEKVTGKAPDCKVKRGYIFDRNLNPLVVSLENYKAYYMLKGNTFLSSSDLAILKKYLGSSLNLSKRGIILLSEDLSLEEVEILKDKKNVIIEKSFKRKILQPYLRFLIGETFNGYGVSGLEKIFNEHLSTGKPIILSIDLNLEKKIYNIIHNFNVTAFGIAVFDLETGELLSYLESDNLKPFDNYYPLNLFGIPPEEVKDFKWVLGDEPILKEGSIIKINTWHLAKWYMDKICHGLIEPTLLLKKGKLCQPDLESLEKREHTIYPVGDTFITVAFKENKMIISSFTFNSTDNLTDPYALNQKLLNYISLQL